MDLSLSETARILGKSERQLRYMLKQGRLPGHKEHGRWVVRRDDLALSPGQERAQAIKQERAFDVAREVLGPKMDGGDSERRLGLRDLRATVEGLAIMKSLAETPGQEHPASLAMREAMMLLAAGDERRAHLRAEL